MKRLRSIYLLALGLVAPAGGCAWIGSFFAAPPPAASPARTPLLVTAQQPRPLTDAAGKPLPVPVYPKAQVFKMTLPVGTFSTNEKVWKLLNEDAIDGKTASILAQNGLHAATGPQAKWPQIAKLIDVPGCSHEEFICQTDNRSAITIVTHGQTAKETIFFVDTDLHMQGRTFEDATNSLRMSMSETIPGAAITILLEPVVQFPPPPMPTRFSYPGAGASNDITLTNLRISTAVEGKDFLVLAPLDPKVNPFSVGGRFLTSVEATPPMECVLVLVPLPAEKPKK